MFDADPFADAFGRQIAAVAVGGLALVVKAEGWRGVRVFGLAVNGVAHRFDGPRLRLAEDGRIGVGLAVVFLPLDRPGVAALRASSGLYDYFLLAVRARFDGGFAGLLCAAVAAVVDRIERPVPGNVAAEVEDEAVGFAGEESKAAAADLRVEAGGHGCAEDGNRVDAGCVESGGEDVDVDEEAESPSGERFKRPRSLQGHGLAGDDSAGLRRELLDYRGNVDCVLHARAEDQDTAAIAC